MDRDRRHTIAHFAVLIVVAWAGLWAWSQEFDARTGWTSQMLYTVPVLVMIGTTAVWSIFALVLRFLKAPSSGSVIIFGSLGIGVWFLLWLGTLIVGPFAGIGEAGVGGPHPIAILFTFAVGLALSWGCALMLSTFLDRGPNVAVVVALILVVIGSSMIASAPRKRAAAEEHRLELAGQNCQSGNLTFDGPNEVTHERCFELGERTRNGEGVAKDLPRAIDIYTWGCLVNEGSSCGALGALYKAGDGVPKDDLKAFDFYAKGCFAFTPNSAACLVASQMLREGVGVARDVSRADAFLSQAGTTSSATRTR